MTQSMLKRSHETYAKKDFRILLVDDEQSIISILDKFLQKKGFSSQKASNGKEALALFNGGKFDLVITDIKMPQMDGVAMAEKLNELGPGIMIIFMTGFAEYQSISRAINTEPFAYLEKPFEPLQMLQLVDKAFARWCEKMDKLGYQRELESTVEEKTKELEFRNERLLAEKELMNGIISQANFGLLAVDTLQTVHLMNTYAHEILELDPVFRNAYMGMSLFDLAGERTRDRFSDLFDIVHESNSLYSVHCHAIPAKILEILAYPVSYRGQITAVVFVIHDISEKEMLQKRLVQSAKLASIGELAAGVAHEINNPLGFVMSNCNTMSRYVANLIRHVRQVEELTASCNPSETVSDPGGQIAKLRQANDTAYIMEDISELLSETHDGLTRVSKIIIDLKTFARAEGDSKETAHVNELIDNALNLVRNEIKYNLEVVREFGQLPEIKCFPNQLVQVFTNLFINAAHAVNEKGILSVATGFKDNMIEIKVRDNGVGIPENVLPRIFDPFFTTKEPGKGTGMGLSISYGLMQKHQGDIHVTSQEGVGTEFTITLPTDSSDGGRDNSETK